MEIQVKYLRDIDKIEKIEKGDWIDLRAGETVKLKKGEYACIPLGVAMKLPEGCEAIVLPRSSTYKHYKVLLTNGMGIIDESYCGNDDEWMFPAYATEDTIIPKNERIAQFRILKHQPSLEFIETDHLEGKNRGGLGSTGRI